MNLTETTLKKLVPTGKDLGRFVGPLNETMERYEIDTLARASMFLANVAHESGGFKYVKELGGPSYFKRYEGRKDLGNVNPGDGVKFFGRGWIQITGRANYTEISKDLGVDFINHPELLETPQYATLSAGWFWDKRNLNALADAGKFTTLVRRINGGLNGLADRQLYYSKAQIILAHLFTENVLSWKPGENIG